MIIFVFESGDNHFIFMEKVDLIYLRNILLLNVQYRLEYVYNFLLL